MLWKSKKVFFCFWLYPLLSKASISRINYSISQVKNQNCTQKGGKLSDWEREMWNSLKNVGSGIGSWSREKILDPLLQILQRYFLIFICLCIYMCTLCFWVIVRLYLLVINNVCIYLFYLPIWIAKFFRKKD